jgi:hypothetical protein
MGEPFPLSEYFLKEIKNIQISSARFQNGFAEHFYEEKWTIKVQSISTNQSVFINPRELIDAVILISSCYSTDE